VIARTKGPEDFYPTAMGNLRFTTNHMAFGVVKTNTTDTVSVIMYNQGSKPITINNFDQPEHISFHCSKMTINPKDTATLTAIYDARRVGGKTLSENHFKPVTHLFRVKTFIRRPV
jgi:hypothetical protein